MYVETGDTKVVGEAGLLALCILSLFVIEAISGRLAVCGQPIVADGEVSPDVIEVFESRLFD